MAPGRADEPTEGLIEGILERAEPMAAGSGHESELLTFVFADIRGYTTFTQQRGDEAAAKLTAKFAAIVRDLVAEFGGTVFELRGDEAMCVFRSPRQAIRLSVAVQQRFVEETVSDANLPLAVGIGIDAGEAVRGADGYRGGALNLAARLCSKAKAGEVLASPEVTHLARTIDGIRYVSLESVAIKGLSETVRPVRVVPDGEDPAVQIAALLATATPLDTTTPRVSWLPGPLATRPRTTVAVAAAVLVVAAGVVVITVSQGSGGKQLRALSENSAGVLDPRTGHLLGQVGVDAGPTAAAAGFGSVWTANTDADTVTRIDASSRQVTRTIEVGSAPSAIATGLNSVWVANGNSGTVSRIDPTTSDIQKITVGTAPGGIVVAAGSVWVTNTVDGTVSRIDPSQGKVVQTIQVGNDPTGISAGRDIWVANSASNTVSEIDGRSHSVTQTIHVGNDPKGIAVIGGDVWVTNNLDGNVARIATNGTTISATVPVGADPTQLAAAGGHLWVATEAAAAVVEIDPASARALRTVRVGAIPTSLTAAGGSLWVTTTIDPTRHRGGTLRLIGIDPGILDPAYLGGVGAYWLLNGSYDGLVSFRHVSGAEGTVIVPDLATAIPEPTNGRRTYAFRLRDGIRWSTGKPLTVFDVRRGLERFIATGYSPMQHEIVGAAGCRLSHCDVRGIAVDPAAHSVTITLVRPIPEFLGQLATGGVAVPASTPLTEQKSHPIPVSGPYQVARYVPGKLLVLTRNRFFREWSAAAQPAGFPDRIEWQIDPHADGKKEVGEVAAGRADWADARFGDPLGALESRFGSRAHVTPTETTHGLVLNTRIAPFKYVGVRRALAFAIDRAAVVAHWPANATVTCQVLPPAFPGHRPDCPYTVRPNATGTWTQFDLATALRLVDASHTRGAKVTVWSLPNTSPGIRDVVSALRSLHYRARLRIYNHPNGDYFGYIANSKHKVQAGFFGWVADNPSASNFFDPLFTCNGFQPGNPLNPNVAEFCDPSIDRLIHDAEHVESTSTTAASDAWAKVDRRIVDAAPWIPLVNPSWVDVVSTRVHHYERSVVLGMFFDQMWVR